MKEGIREEGRHILGLAERHQKLVMVIGGIAGIILLYEWYKNKQNQAISYETGLDGFGLSTVSGSGGIAPVAAEAIGQSSVNFSSVMGSSLTSTGNLTKTSNLGLFAKFKALGLGISSVKGKQLSYAMESNVPDTFEGSLSIGGADSSGSSAADLLLLAGGTYAQRAEQQHKMLEEQTKLASFLRLMPKVTPKTAERLAKEYGYIAA